jgi:hypothetical protein
MSEDPQERFRRISARMLEPGLREEELEELAREWVEVKEEVLRMQASACLSGGRMWWPSTSSA